MDKESLLEVRKNFGQKLRELRESQGISLEGLAHTTKISLAFIKALEDGEFEKLPGRVFGRGFVKSLVKTMGVPESDWSQAFSDAFGVDIGGKVSDRSSSLHPSESFERTSEARRQASRSRQAATKHQLFLGSIRFFQSLKIHGAVYGLTIAVIAGGVFFLAAPKSRDWLHQLRSGWNEKSRGDATLISTQSLEQSPETEAIQEPQIANWEINWHHLWSPHWQKQLEALELGEGLPFIVPRKVAIYEGPIVGDSYRDANDPIGLIFKSKGLSEAKFAGFSNESSGADFSEQSPITATEAEKLQESQIQEISASSSPSEKHLEVAINVLEPVRIKMGIDGDAMKNFDLKVDQHRFQFREKMDLLVYDAGAVTIQFDGRDLGSLGQKGRVRRLTFKSRNDLPHEKED